MGREALECRASGSEEGLIEDRAEARVEDGFGEGSEKV